MKAGAWSVLMVMLCVLVRPVPAPVPRCSPFFIINKMAEFTSFLSDSNPYFPMPPCEYGGWMQALNAGDYEAVFLSANPAQIPRHNFYEFTWLLKTGIPRLMRIAQGREEMLQDPKILTEGYTRHYTPNVRTTQLGHGTVRRPEIIDDEKLFDRVSGQKVNNLIYQGPDKRPTNYTPQGQLRRAATLQAEYVPQPQLPEDPYASQVNPSPVDKTYEQSE